MEQFKKFYQVYSRDFNFSIVCLCFLLFFSFCEYVSYLISFKAVVLYILLNFFQIFFAYPVVYEAFFLIEEWLSWKGKNKKDNNEDEECR